MKRKRETHKQEIINYNRRVDYYAKRGFPTPGKISIKGLTVDELKAAAKPLKDYNAKTAGESDKYIGKSIYEGKIYESIFRKAVREMNKAYKDGITRSTLNMKQLFEIYSVKQNETTRAAMIEKFKKLGELGYKQFYLKSLENAKLNLVNTMEQYFGEVGWIKELSLDDVGRIFANGFKMRDIYDAYIESISDESAIEALKKRIMQIIKKRRR